jgi:hypothetical protein
VVPSQRCDGGGAFYEPQRWIRPLRDDREGLRDIAGVPCLSQYTPVACYGMRDGSTEGREHGSSQDHAWFHGSLQVIRDLGSLSDLRATSRTTRPSASIRSSDRRTVLEFSLSTRPMASAVSSGWFAR